MNSNKQNLINKILYRSQYRGTKEMDIFLSSFVKSIINSLNYDELIELSNIINLNDDEIINNLKNNNKLLKNKMLDLMIDFKNNQ